MGYHVAIFTPDLNLGGAQHVTVNLANGLADRGNDVDLVMPTRQGKLFDDVSEAVDFVFLKNDLWPIIGSISSILEYKQYLEHEQPDIVLSQRTHGNVASMLAVEASRYPVPIALTEHTWYNRTDNIKDKINLFLANRLYRRSDAIICVSDGVADSVRTETHIPEEKLWKIHNPFEIESIVQQSSEPLNHPWFKNDNLKVILSAGRLEKVKNFSLLIKSFAELHKFNSNYRLVILGEGSQREYLQSKIKTYGLKNVAELPGYVDNPYKYMRSAHVFVLTSTFEGFGNVLIEAMASGCPVVSTNNSSGPVEILVEGMYGNLVKSNIIHICSGIEDALSNSVNERDLLKRARDFAPEAILDDYEQLIHELSQN